MSRPPPHAPAAPNGRLGSSRATSAEQHVPQRGRQRRLAAGGGRQQLAREERVAPRPRDDRGHERLRQRVGGVRDERPRRLARERLELQHGAGEAGASRCSWSPGRISSLR